MASGIESDRSPLLHVGLEGSSKKVLIRTEEENTPPRLSMENRQSLLCSFAFRNGLLLTRLFPLIALRSG